MNKPEEYLRSQIRKGTTPSLQYAFFDSEEIIFSFDEGFADIANQKTVNERTTSNFFSITKTFTALAILQLQDLGILDIDQPVVKYLPDFPYGVRVTVRNLLDHTGGVPNPMPLRWIHLTGEHIEFDPKTYFKNVITRHERVRSEPGNRFAYSNLGYVILGQVIEAVSGICYEHFIEENILNKLGLPRNEIGFVIPDFERHSVGYHPRWTLSNLILGLLLDRPKFMLEPIGDWVPFKTFYVNGAAYGGLIGTMNSLVRYAQALLQPSGKLMSDRAKVAMFSENATNEGKSTGMCLSWFKDTLNGETYFTHAGGGGGYYSEIRLYPKLGRASVLLMNRTGFRDERFLDTVDKYFMP